MRIQRRMRQLRRWGRGRRTLRIGGALSALMAVSVDDMLTTGCLATSNITKQEGAQARGREKRPQGGGERVMMGRRRRGFAKVFTAFNAGADYLGRAQNAGRVMRDGRATQSFVLLGRKMHCNAMHRSEPRVSPNKTPVTPDGFLHLSRLSLSVLPHRRCGTRGQMQGAFLESLAPDLGRAGRVPAFTSICQAAGCGRCAVLTSSWRRPTGECAAAGHTDRQTVPTGSAAVWMDLADGTELGRRRSWWCGWVDEWKRVRCNKPILCSMLLQGPEGTASG